MRLLHLSDTHATDHAEALRGLLEDCRRVPGIEGVVVTGDLTDEGAPEAYALVRKLVASFAEPRGIPVVYAIGNHDSRTAFGAPTRSVTEVGGYRIVALDSVVANESYGRVGPGQLGWLRDVLSTPAQHGTVLALHHPPIAVPGVVAQRKFGLRDSADLAETIAGSDVRLILCGHYHAQVFGMLGTIPVWVTAGVVSRLDMAAGEDLELFVRGASASVVDLGVPYSPVIHTVQARDPRAGEVVFEKRLA